VILFKSCIALSSKSLQPCSNTRLRYVHAGLFRFIAIMIAKHYYIFRKNWRHVAI